MNKYLIATCVGGLMEMSSITYENFEVIESETQKIARLEYNRKHNCNYFYGECLAQKINGEIKILNKSVSYKNVELLND